MTPDESAEAIRCRMAELRRELACDVEDVTRSARNMANPMYYIRHFPWASAVVAAAVGYLLVPKKKHVVRPDAETLAEMVRKRQVKVDTTQAGTDSQSMLKSLVVMGLTWALRTGLQYAGQQFVAAAAKKAHSDEAAHPHDEALPPSPSPLEEPWNQAR